MSTKIFDEYDWMVIGDHPGSLLGACMAAKMGYRVLMIHAQPELTADLTSSGQLVDFESNFSLGFGQGGGFSGLSHLALTHLGISSNYQKLVKDAKESSAQILTPETRIQFFAEVSDWTHECLREFGSQFQDPYDLLGTLDLVRPILSGYWRRYPQSFKAPETQPTLARRLKELKPESAPTHEEEWLSLIGMPSKKNPWLSKNKHFRDLELTDSKKAWLWGLACSQLQVFNEASYLSTLDVLHALALSGTGVSFRGGLTAYRKFLIQLAERLGAHLLQEECRSIFVEEGKFRGIQVSSHGKLIVGKNAILGCGLDLFRDRLFQPSGPSKLPLVASPPVEGWLFTLAMTVNLEAIPPGLGSRTVWKELGAPAVEIEVVNPEDYQTGANDRKLIFVRTQLPYTQEALSVAYQKKIASRLFRLTKRLLPYLEYHVVKLYPDFRDEQREDTEDFSEKYGFVSPEMIPHHLRLYYGDGVGVNSGVNGLFLASQESYPRLGTLGPTVAAIESLAKGLLQRGGNEFSKFQELWRPLE